MERERTRPSLDTIRIPTPCPKRWEELEGEGGRRWCEACRFHVRDLSALTRPEAEAFLAGSAGRTCVTYLQRRDGSIVTKPERAGVLRSTLTVFARAAAGLLALVALLPGCNRRTMGRVSAAPDDPSSSTSPRTVGRVAAPDLPSDVPQRLVGEVCLPEPIRVPDEAAQGQPGAEAGDARHEVPGGLEEPRGPSSPGTEPSDGSAGPPQPK